VEGMRLGGVVGGWFDGGVGREVRGPGGVGVGDREMGEVVREEPH